MAAVITGVGLLGAGIAYWVALNEANGFMDLQLRQIARSSGPTLHRRELPTVHHDPEDDFVVQIFNPQGTLTSAGEQVVDLPRQTRPGFSTLQAAGTLWRVYTAIDDGTTVQVAQQVEVRRELAETAALQVAIPLLILVPLGCLVVGWAMSQALGDLKRLAQHVESLPADSRDPIDLARVPSEVAPLVVAMNRLIERLREGLTQQRAFLSNAAHELRTPLTAIELQIANLVHAGGDASPELLADLSHGARRAGTLVEQLLRLARYDTAPSCSDDLETVDLKAVLFDAVADHIPLAESRSIDLGVISADQATLAGRPHDLRIMFGYLIDNAVKYTPEGGTVDVGITKRGYAIEITICDTGPGIKPAVLPRVFDRFFRATSAQTEGSGLGLAIAQAIAEQHGFGIVLGNRPGGSGLQVTVSNRAPPSPVRTGKGGASRSPGKGQSAAIHN